MENPFDIMPTSSKLFIFSKSNKSRAAKNPCVTQFDSKVNVVPTAFIFFEDG